MLHAVLTFPVSILFLSKKLNLQEFFPDERLSHRLNLVVNLYRSNEKHYFVACSQF